MRPFRRIWHRHEGHFLAIIISPEIKKNVNGIHISSLLINESKRLIFFMSMVNMKYIELCFFILTKKLVNRNVHQWSSGGILIKGIDKAAWIVSTVPLHYLRKALFSTAKKSTTVCRLLRRISERIDKRHVHCFNCSVTLSCQVKESWLIS